MWYWFPQETTWPEPLTSIVTVPPTVEPLTLDEGKLRANLDWLDGDPRDALMLAWIQTARARVEFDTGRSLLTQTREAYADTLGWITELPERCRPLQHVTSITYTDATGQVQTVDPAVYTVDVARGRIVLNRGQQWPTGRNYALPWVITLDAGWPDVASIDPIPLQLVGLLTAHLATLGRDLATVDPAVVEIPYGYKELLDSYIAVSVA